MNTYKLDGSYSAPSNILPPPQPKNKEYVPVLDTTNIEMYVNNYKTLGDAICKSGGNPFIILKKHDDLFRNLANNNIVFEKVSYKPKNNP